MSPDEFFSLVRDMRKAQKNYFKTRDAGWLRESMRLEKQVDALVNDEQKALPL